MLGVPQFADTRTVTNYGIVGSGTPGTSVPQAGTTLNYGTLTELISAANNNIGDCWGIEICVLETGASATAAEASVDIYIGGATDDLFIKALLCGGAYAASVRNYFFPVHIPTGVRIAAQLASVNTTGIAPTVMVTLYGGTPPPFRVGSRVTTYGTQSNNARGVTVTPTASGGAASVTQITASSTYDHFYFMPGFQVSTDTTMQQRNYNIGIGIGASTEERIGTWWYFTSAAEHIAGPWPTLGAFRDVPAGTRLTLLASNSGANDASADGLIYAVS